MYYSRPTLISNWHKNREAEPKDYDFTASPEGEKTLHKSTYKHFGTCMDAGWSTTTESQMSQCHLKKEYEVKDTPKSIVQGDHFQSLIFDRETGRSTAGSNTILPCHRPDHNQMDLDSTYKQDYLPPYDYNKEVMATKDLSNSSPDFRKPQSLFTDLADHHRWGRNTWQDENEVHHGVEDKTRIWFKHSNPICP